MSKFVPVNKTWCMYHSHGDRMLCHNPLDCDVVQLGYMVDSPDPVLDRLREMFGIEATDVEGVFAALEAYDRKMHQLAFGSARAAVASPRDEQTR